MEDSASSQALEGDIGSAGNSSSRIIPEAPQEPTKDDAPSVGKDVQLSGSQECPKNPGTMSAGDLMEVDAPPGNKESDGKDEIAAEIEQLKKEQKKIQMRTELHCLREHKAQRSVKDVLEQESYAQKLVLKRAKKVRDPNVYWKENQCAFDKYVSQVDLVFQTKSLTYISKKAKCLYAAAFLGGISQCEWVAKNQKIKADPD